MSNINELRESYKREAPSGLGAGLITYAALSAVEAGYKYNKANQQGQLQDQSNPGFFDYLVSSLFSRPGLVLISYAVGFLAIPAFVAFLLILGAIFGD